MVGLFLPSPPVQILNIKFTNLRKEKACQVICYQEHTGDSPLSGHSQQRTPALPSARSLLTTGPVLIAGTF